MTQHSSAVDAISEVERALADARASGHFMVAVWSFDNGHLKCHRTSWQFPKPKMEDAIQLLGALLQAELEQIETTPPPLPLARIFDAALQTAQMPSSPASDDEEQSSEERPHG